MSSDVPGARQPPKPTLPTATLHGLADRFSLPASAEARLHRLLDLLVADPQAPTSIRDPARALEDHLADSLVALELPVFATAATILDIGSGAGLPALPLAIALPRAEVVALDSVTRKVAFAQHAIAACELDNARAVWARAEAWPEGHQAFDVVTARALAPLEVVAEWAAPFLRPGGALVAWRGRREPEVEAATQRAAEILGLVVEEVRAVHPYAAAENRHLHLLRKVAPTPKRFPRRPGVARKRPLGAENRGPV